MQKVIFEESCKLDELHLIVNKVYHLMEQTPVLLLKGDLGAGKTTFTSLLMKSFGIIGNASSPTFNILNEYSDASGSTFYHFDLYRIKHPEELEQIGFSEYLDSNRPCIIEWPKIGMDYILDEFLLLEIEHEEGLRKYRLSRNSNE